MYKPCLITAEAERRSVAVRSRGERRSRENTMAAGLIVVLVVVGLLAIVAWPVTVMLSKHRLDIGGRLQPPAEHRRANVQGGTHVGGGRSVGPRRDAEVVPDQDPNEPTVPVRE
jgi:hypothetical protein